MVNRLSAEQVAGIASVGTPEGTTVAEWVAKAREENAGFDADMVGLINPWDVGIWQVNVRANRDLIPEAQVSLENARSALKSPPRNWEVTKMIFARQGWQAWQASGGRPSVSADDRQAAANADSSVSDSGGSVDGAAEQGVKGLSLFGFDLFDDVAKAIGLAVQVVVDAGKWLTDTHNLERIGFVVGGTVVAIGAGYIIARPTVEPVVRDAKSIATKGLA